MNIPKNIGKINNQHLLLSKIFRIQYKSFNYVDIV
jgi:hypothetical protein